MFQNTHAFPLLETWGFNYYCMITWDKVSRLTHQGFFRKTEFVVFGYKGKLNQCIKETGKPIPAVFREAKGKHSKKPQAFDNIIRLATQEPRLDMFARKKKIGFDSYGDEIEEELEIETLEAFS